MVGIFLLACCLFCSSCGAKNEQPKTLRLIASIPLLHVKGRLDHFAFNLKDRRLYLSALGNGTVEILDLDSNKYITSIKGLNEPQGVAFLGKYEKLCVANGGKGVCLLYDKSNLREISRLELGDDADNIRYDTERDLIYVGSKSGSLNIIDANTFTVMKEIPLRGHPEAFEAEKNGSRIFINVPPANEITVYDRKNDSIAHWKLPHGSENFPMALNEKTGLLFVGCRNPAELLVINTQTGEIKQKIPISNDPDDIFFDETHQRVYISCGAGEINILEHGKSGFFLKEKIPTVHGARTSQLILALDRYYVACPKNGIEPAHINIYEIL